MARWSRILGLAVVSSTVASATSSVALAALAHVEGKGALQPVNATSHWRNGEPAAAVTGFDLAHTGVGYATHHAATFFWAVFFEAWIAWRGPRTPWTATRDALALSAIAVVADYGATPKRFTPGWEFVLSKRAMAGTYVAMALGFAVSAMRR
ncbi:hypothetical protein [Lichenicoccus sp.]|uniref:hypothetical protein n=1 Tax=Lichenicoccus sp. TaxID=2781899 RepID=UPI003D1461BA